MRQCTCVSLEDRVGGIVLPEAFPTGLFGEEVPAFEVGDGWMRG